MTRGTQKRIARDLQRSRRPELDALDEFARGHAQGAGELDDVSQAEVALASLDPADVVAMQVRLLREGLLRQPALAPQGRYPKAEPDLLRMARHKRTLRRCTLSVLHTMSVMSTGLETEPLARSTVARLL